jgi:hypothetical protein
MVQAQTPAGGVMAGRVATPHSPSLATVTLAQSARHLLLYLQQHDAAGAGHRTDSKTRVVQARPLVGHVMSHQLSVMLKKLSGNRRQRCRAAAMQCVPTHVLPSLPHTGMNSRVHLQAGAGLGLGLGGHSPWDTTRMGLQSAAHWLP